MYQLFPLCVNIGPLFEEPQALIEDPRHSVDSVSAGAFPCHFQLQCVSLRDQAACSTTKIAKVYEYNLLLIFLNPFETDHKIESRAYKLCRYPSVMSFCCSSKFLFYSRSATKLFAYYCLLHILEKILPLIRKTLESLTELNQ